MDVVTLALAKKYTNTFNSQVTNITPTSDGTGLVFTVVGGETFTISVSDWNVLTDDEKEKLEVIDTSGDGTKYLADDGVYKTIQNSYTLPVASESELGGVKVGNNLNIDENGVLSATSSGSIDDDWRWNYVEGTIYPTYLYNWNTKTNNVGGTLYTSLYYAFDGEKKVRLSGTSSGSVNKLAYVFVDDDSNVISKAPETTGTQYTNLVLDVPNGATGIWLNGNNYTSPHLEVAIVDEMADTKTLPYLLKAIAPKIQYRDTFAWKPLPNAIFAFTFDDSNEGTQDIVSLFETLGQPACFGTIPEKLNTTLSNGKTVAEILTEAVVNGCEVLAHGSASERVTADTIDDENFLYNKFVVNKQKFLDYGFNVRGCVRVGGTGQLDSDARTDSWVRMLFDYCDLYGLAEPYNHPRVSDGYTLETAKAVVDAHILSKDFCPLLYHDMPDYISDLVAYILEQGGTISNYADVYDTYGSTVSEVALENKVQENEDSIGDISTVLNTLVTVTE